MKLTPEVAQAFVSLRGNRDFATFLTWLAENETKNLSTCVAADGLQLYRAQGAVGVLSDIKKAYNEAPLVLKKLSSNPPVVKGEYA